MTQTSFSFSIIWTLLWFLSVMVVFSVMLGFIRIFIIGPFRIWRRDRIPMALALEPIELTHLPPAAQQYSIDSIREFAAMGFVSRGTVRTLTKAGQGWTTIWVNEQTREIAQVIAATIRMKEGLRITRFAQFITEFTDGTGIATSNPFVQSVLPRNPLMDSIHIPAIKDTAELYRLHQLHVKHDQGDRVATLDKVTDAVTRLQATHDELCKRLADAGYYLADPATQQYIPTIKCAILQNLAPRWPFRVFVRRRRKQRVLESLARLGYPWPPAKPQPLPPLAQ